MIKTNTSSYRIFSNHRSIVSPAKSSNTKQFFYTKSPIHISLARLILSGFGLILFLNAVSKEVYGKKTSLQLYDSYKNVAGYSFVDDEFVTYLGDKLTKCKYTFDIKSPVKKNDTKLFKKIDFTSTTLNPNNFLTPSLIKEYEKNYIKIIIFLNTNKAKTDQEICLAKELKNTINEINEEILKLTLKQNTILANLLLILLRTETNDLSIENLIQRRQKIDEARLHNIIQLICAYISLLSLFLHRVEIIRLFKNILDSSYKRPKIIHSSYQIKENTDVKNRIIKISEKIKEINKDLEENKEIISKYNLFLEDWTCPLRKEIISTPFHDPELKYLVELKTLHNNLSDKNNTPKDKFNYKLTESIFHKNNLLKELSEIENLIKKKV